ncbi:MAG: SDR family NAD(P)-dependent oxidoreductase [Thermoplasmatales archaeon]|nr:SDR family NAD(P)-dependent oxidoreductase [Candidatus Thermoplasmatota archaeon]MCL6002228.1 SDR family NAD(P)-dependent oxidoreductase [Candidatus Thermoplasmatota archaeon]MDA8055483.1 SDR family NAD(P)-dependent oxidoreductase [Thermoplasmatales archaeon]
MELKGNTILITGGATGIGFSFADRLSKLGNTVIICGRRRDKLEEAQSKSPHILTFRADVSSEKDRRELFDYVEKVYPKLNVLINNAGIQRRVNLNEGERVLKEIDYEIEINFRSQVHMTATFLPLLLAQNQSAIVNVTSGLGIIPLSIFPTYSATKAAMHSYTISLRHQLKSTNVKVFEVIPPTVHDTELKGKPLERSEYSISTTELTDAFIAGLEKDVSEIAAGSTLRWLEASGTEMKQIFYGMNH